MERPWLNTHQACSLSWIKRAAHPFASAMQHVCIDHGRFDVFMAQKFLHGANIITILQEMGGEAVPQGMAVPTLVNASLLYSRFHRLLQDSVRHVMAPFFA